MLPERSDRIVYLRVLAPLLLAVGTLVLMSMAGFHALSGARAFVGGESLWSKARSHTVTQLRQRAGGASDLDCEPLTTSLAVPLGDRDARIALDRSPPDLDTARAGLLRGGAEPGDVDSMINLYLNFGSTALMREAIEAWALGDTLIERLHELGERICAAPPAAERDTAALAAIERLDDALIRTELRFSNSLAEASRVTGRLLTAAIVIVALLLVTGSAWFALRSLRAQIVQRRALSDANARWELAAEAVGSGLFVWNPASDRVELDRRARALFGFDGQPWIARRDLIAMIHADDLPAFRQLQRDAIGSTRTLRARFRVRRRDGEERQIEGAGQLLASEPSTDTRRRMVGVLRDVTDEVVAARLQVERDAAERSARARSEFLSRLSHELRTPLNAVLGLAQLLEIDTHEPLTPAQRGRVQQLLDSGWHLLHLVDDVLDITRIDSGQLAIRPVSTDLRPVLRASLALVEPERARFGVTIDDRWPALPPRALADPQRLQQVFVNLLSNACKYNRPGGTVTLTCSEHGAEVCLGVADEGVGIDPAQFPELFQPFKRLPQTAQIPGTGLGLVVVKLLTEQMQGRVELTSEPGRGSRFTICLRRC